MTRVRRDRQGDTTDGRDLEDLESDRAASGGETEIGVDLPPVAGKELGTREDGEVGGVDAGVGALGEAEKEASFEVLAITVKVSPAFHSVRVITSLAV